MDKNKKIRKTVEMNLENYLVDIETKYTANYYLWCRDVKFYGFDSVEKGHLIWAKDFIKKARDRAISIQRENTLIDFDKTAKKVIKREIARRLTPEEVIKAVKLEYKNDYALLQLRIIHNELVINNNPLADLFIPEILSYKWVGIFYGEIEFNAFKYIIDELPNKDQKKVLFKILWSMYNKILIKCKGELWDEWVHKEYFPKQKVTKIAGKYDGNTGSPLFQKVLRISKKYTDPKVFEYNNLG